MSLSNSNIIRHADISKLSDKQLKIELQYIMEQCERALDKVRLQTWILEHIAKDPEINYDHYPDRIPLTKLHEDYRLHTERLEHIVQEIYYRRIP